MARRRTPEQVIAKVRQGQKMLKDGRPMVEVIKELQVTEATWYRWLNQYGSEKNAEASKRTRRRTPALSACWRRRNWPSTS
jgi:putative transposase